MKIPPGPASWVDRLHATVCRAPARRRWLLAFAAGAASVLSMAPFHAWPVLFLTLPVLVWLVDGAVADGAESTAARLRQSFAAGWWFGFGYFVFGLFWIGEAFLVEAEKYALLIPFAVTLLPAGLAVFFGMAAASASAAWPRGFARVLVLAITVAAAEWLRGNILTGLPWNTLGYALTYPLPLMQAASIFGTYGLTLWAVLIGAAPLVLAAGAPAGETRRRAWLNGLAVSALPLALAFIYGSLKLVGPPAPLVDGVRMRIVQPSVLQRDKWRPDKQREIFALHLDLSRRNPAGIDDGLSGTTHIIWPEAAMPFLPLEHPEASAEIARLLGGTAYLMSGALRLSQSSQGSSDGTAIAEQLPALRRVFNTLLVFSPGGALAGTYDKNHLVPFGEYLPMPDLWRSFGLRGLVEMRGALTPGVTPRPLLDVPGLPKVGALICYEAIFPGDVVQGHDRPKFLLSITNDGWFGNTTGPRQHFHQARVRAVEEGLPLVRSANNGISAVFDAEGRVLHRLDLDVKGTIDSDLPGARPPTIYGRFGDGVFALSMLAFALAGIVLARR